MLAVEVAVLGLVQVVQQEVVAEVLVLMVAAVLLVVMELIILAAAVVAVEMVQHLPLRVVQEVQVSLSFQSHKYNLL
jgi:hypothetical protein